MDDADAPRELCLTAQLHGTFEVWTDGTGPNPFEDIDHAASAELAAAIARSPQGLPRERDLAMLAAEAGSDASDAEDADDADQPVPWWSRPRDAATGGGGEGAGAAPREARGERPDGEGSDADSEDDDGDDLPQITAVRMATELTLHQARYTHFERISVPEGVSCAEWIERRMASLRSAVEEPEEWDAWNDQMSQFSDLCFPGPRDISMFDDSDEEEEEGEDEDEAEDGDGSDDETESDRGEVG